jgi:hypothetical protein
MIEWIAVKIVNISFKWEAIKALAVKNLMYQQGVARYRLFKESQENLLYIGRTKRVNYTSHQKITLDFPAWVGYNKLQVEQYDGAVTTELNIVNPTSMCKCRHTQALGSFYTI